MAESDLILLVVLAILVGAAGYLFGTRSRRIAKESSQAAPKRASLRAGASKAGASKSGVSKAAAPNGRKMDEGDRDADPPASVKASRAKASDAKASKRSPTVRVELAASSPPTAPKPKKTLVESPPPPPAHVASEPPPAHVASEPPPAHVASEPPSAHVASEPPPVTVASDPPPSGRAKPPTVMPPASPFPADVEIVKMSYEEDEDVEPTRVGKNPILQAPVQRLVYDEDAESDEPTRVEPFFVISATAQTDPGLRRKRNEDNLLVLDEASLYVVADGMGGHRGGKLASEIAVKTIGAAHREKNFEGEVHDSIPRDASELARAIQMANASILDTAKKQPDLEGMGTTVCAIRFSPKKRRFFIGHVGDSRCYRLREGVMSQLTADHTMADFGVAGPESAHLSRAIGIWPVVPIDVILGAPALGDVYLLCSDGLTKMLDDDMIAQVLRNEEDPKSAVERLVFFANARGGKDNVTVVLLRVVSPSEAHGARSAEGAE